MVLARGQLAYYRALEQQGDIRVITDCAGLDRHMADWIGWESAGASGPNRRRWAS